MFKMSEFQRKHKTFTMQFLLDLHFTSLTGALEMHKLLQYFPQRQILPIGLFPQLFWFPDLYMTPPSSSTSATVQPWSIFMLSVDYDVEIHQQAMNDLPQNHLLISHFQSDSVSKLINLLRDKKGD